MIWAREIAKAVFENDGPAVYRAFSKMLRKGSPYAFAVLSDRAYGKLKERHEVEISPYREMTDDQIRERSADLERQLGVVPALTDDAPN